MISAFDIRRFYFPESTSKESLKSSDDNENRKERLSSGEGPDSFQKLVKIKSYTMSNSNKMEVVLINWGATIVSLKCPDKFGRSVDVVIGFNDLESVCFNLLL